MNSAREAVLGALRAANGSSAAAAAPAWRPLHTRPAFGGDALQRLHHKLQARSASVEHLAWPADVPAAVLRYLAAHGLPGRLACAPALAHLPWPHGLLDLHSGAARRDALVSLTPCLAAVAESGVLVLVSGPRTPTTLNFVPEHHLVVLHADSVVPHLEDAWELLRARHAAHGGMPRAVNVISGPSRTADVEQTLQLGAHGPRRLHVMIVGADRPAA